jgi:hypothetical protein
LSTPIFIINLDRANVFDDIENVARQVNDEADRTGQNLFRAADDINRLVQVVLPDCTGVPYVSSGARPAE